MTPDSTQKCPPRVVSKCCGADVIKRSFCHDADIFYTEELTRLKGGGYNMRLTFFCKNCGNSIKDWAVICSQCHKPYEVEAKEGDGD